MTNPHAKKFVGLFPQNNSFTKNYLKPFETPKASRMSTAPMLNVVAVLFGITTMKGNIISEKIMNTHPTKNKPTNHL